MAAADGGKVNRACLLTGPNAVEIGNVPYPQVKNDDVLVKVEVTGLCGSDVSLSFCPSRPSFAYLSSLSLSFGSSL